MFKWLVNLLAPRPRRRRIKFTDGNGHVVVIELPEGIKAVEIHNIGAGGGGGCGEVKTEKEES